VLSATGTNLLWYNTATGGIGSVSAPPINTNVPSLSTYYVSQTLSSCTSNRAAILVEIAPSPELGVPVTEAICIGAVKNYLQDFASFSTLEVLGSNNLPIDRPDSVTQEGTYQIIATTNGCSDTTLRTLLVVPPPAIYAGGDTIAMVGKPLQLRVVGAPVQANYSWLALPPGSDAVFSNPNSASPTVTLTQPAYTLVAKADVGGGCTATDTMQVKVLAGPAFYVPNAFSPNGDMLNDVFRPFAPGMTLRIFRVYNRYGQVIFETNKATQGWDGTYLGKAQPTGNYVWYVQGTLANGIVLSQKGNVLLVR
jgi:gliding motility-associated-like protein